MPVLSANGLWKKYSRTLQRSLWYGLQDVAREAVGAAPADEIRPGEFWALRELSLEVQAGEAVAVVGHNGAGKSTLLRVLNGLLKPDRGKVRTAGRVAAILELGTGLSPLLTGRENIALGAAMNRLHGADARRLMTDVVEFAELQEFIDGPVQSYSSGMRARLAYALAAHLKPDLLLIDEVLAVGDMAFQRKCVNHMRGFLENGGALLLVSHNTFQIQSVCQTGILLENGQTTYSGSAVEVLNRMLESRSRTGTEATAQSSSRGPVSIVGVSIDPIDEPNIRTGGPATLAVHYNASQAASIHWGFGIWSADGWVCITGDFDMGELAIEAGQGLLSCSIPRVPLMPGRYLLRASILEPGSNVPLAAYGWANGGSVFDVQATPCAVTNAQMQLNQMVAIDVEWTRGRSH